jgi:hypothetical protein
MLINSYDVLTVGVWEGMKNINIYKMGINPVELWKSREKLGVETLMKRALERAKILTTYSSDRISCREFVVHTLSAASYRQAVFAEMGYMPALIVRCGGDTDRELGKMIREGFFDSEQLTRINEIISHILGGFSFELSVDENFCVYLTVLHQRKSPLTISAILLLIRILPALCRLGDHKEFLVSFVSFMYFAITNVSKIADECGIYSGYGMAVEDLLAAFAFMCPPQLVNDNTYCYLVNGPANYMKYPNRRPEEWYVIFGKFGVAKQRNEIIKIYQKYQSHFPSMPEMYRKEKKDATK